MRYINMAPSKKEFTISEDKETARSRAGCEPPMTVKRGP